MCTRMFGFYLALLATSVAAPASAQQREQIGETLSVINVVTAEFNRDTRTLQPGDGVHQSELIEVGIEASSELKLNDETKLALGAGSKLLLDKFVYDPQKTAGTIGVNLVKGAFRFITGVADKPSYSIKVPKASITVRGTIFDVHVQPDTTTWVLLHEGAVTVCNERGKCREHNEPGKLLRITDQGEVGTPEPWAGLPGNNAVPFDDAFPFVVKPPSVDPKPVFTREALLRLGDLPKSPIKAPETTPATTPEDTPQQLDRGELETLTPGPSKKTRRVEDDDKPVKKKKVYVEEPKSEKKKPVVKVALPKPEKKKPARTTKNTTNKKNDEAAAKAFGAAIGIGIGIGLGGGFGKKGGNHGGGHGGHNKY